MSVQTDAESLLAMCREERRLERRRIVKALRERAAALEARGNNDGASELQTLAWELEGTT